MLTKKHQRYIQFIIFLQICRVNNCVGENNQKYFVLFTVSSAIQKILCNRD